MTNANAPRPLNVADEGVQAVSRDPIEWPHAFI